jgi:hypothetical protein
METMQTKKMVSEEQEAEILRTNIKQLRRLKRKLFLEAIRDQESCLGRSQNFSLHDVPTSRSVASSSNFQSSLTME